MKEPLEVEYPTQDISRSPPVFESDPNALPTLSKKARKQLAASNCIAYARSMDPIDGADLAKTLSVHGPCVVYIIKPQSPSTAFVKFETSSACAIALAAKTANVTLPRHKRIDIPTLVNEEPLRKYLAGVGDIKAITVADDLTTVEFLTALGAAQAIVRFQTIPFQGTKLHVDYSPSLKLDGDQEGPFEEFHGDGDHLSVYSVSISENSPCETKPSHEASSSEECLLIGVETMSVSHS